VMLAASLWKERRLDFGIRAILLLVNDQGLAAFGHLSLQNRRFFVGRPSVVAAKRQQRNAPD